LEAARPDTAMAVCALACDRITLCTGEKGAADCASPILSNYPVVLLLRTLSISPQDKGRGERR
jgi:hypothetical protein